MKRIILTGATGFIGANLARRLLHEGHEVHLLVRPGYVPWRIEGLRSQVHLHEVDFCEVEAVFGIVAAIQPQWVFHLAAHGAYSWQNDPHEITQTNVVGTGNLLQACLKSGFEAFINTGTSSEYGLKDHPPTEDEWVDPNSYYAVSKASATTLCRYVAQSRQANVITLRLYSAFGAYEDPNRLIPTVILRGLKGELPPLVNPGVARDFVYVDDVVEAYLATAQHPQLPPGAVYNIGTGIQTTIAQVVEVAQRVLGLQVEPKWGTMADRHWDTSVWVADSTRARSELGWQPRHGFEEGFRAIVDWFHDNPDLIAQYGRLTASR